MKTTITEYAAAVILAAFACGHAAAQLPTNFPGITVTAFDSNAVAPGRVFLAVATETPGIGTYLMILENDGSPSWYREINTGEIYDFKVLPNGLLHFAPFIEAHSFAGGGDVTHEIVNPDYTPRETVQAGNGYIAESHDFQMLPNGHILLFGYYLIEVDMSRIVPGGHPAALVAGSVVQELDAQRNVILQWRAWDHTTLEDYFRPLQDDPKAKNPVINTFHLNSINLDTDGHIVISTPQGGANLSATSGWIEKLNRQTGERMWRLGGTENQFTFVGVSQAEGLQAFSGHGFHRLPNGNVLIYDNGSVDRTRTSRVYEFTLDETNRLAIYVWRYTPPVITSGNQRGNAQRLPNGNTFIGWGGLMQIPACTEVTAAGAVVFDLKFNDPRVGSYRAFRSIWPPFQSNTVALTELATGNTYDFEGTGLRLRVISGGGGYNELSVTREPYAPVYPVFQGKAPCVLPVRVKLNEYGLPALQARLEFSAPSFGWVNPTNLTVYCRPQAGVGIFTPQTTTYNPVTSNLVATLTLASSGGELGEIVFGYPDLAEVPYPPLLAAVENYRGAQSCEVIGPWMAVTGRVYEVNQELPIALSWSTRGFARWYTVQIATNLDFANPVVDVPYATAAFYVWSNAVPDTTYFYRVKTWNYGGESDWADGAFVTVAPRIGLAAPNGGEAWQRGQRYFIRWNDNIPESVVVDLYKGGVFLESLTTNSSTGAYQWEVGLDLAPGNDYSIRVSSSTRGALFDTSDRAFNIDAPVINPASVIRRLDGRVQFELTASGAAQATVWGATNLSPPNWQVLQTVFLTNSSAAFTDDAAPGFSVRFYRVTVP